LVSGYPVDDGVPVASLSLRPCLEVGAYRSRLSLLLSLVSLLSLSRLYAMPLLSRGSRGGGRAFDSRLGGLTVWLSQGVGVGVFDDLPSPETDRTILLSFSVIPGGQSAMWHGTTNRC
jgi:hypothetical protein